MILVAISTPCQMEFLKIFLSSIKDDWEIDIQIKKLKQGIFRSHEFFEFIKEKNQKVVHYLERNETVIMSDTDIEFFKPAQPLIDEALKKHDLLFQAGRVDPDKWKPGDGVNTGFIVIKPTQANIDLFKTAIANPNGTFEHEFNKILNVINTPHGVLPIQFWKLHFSHIPKDMVMHHAVLKGEKAAEKQMEKRNQFKLQDMERIRCMITQ